MLGSKIYNSKRISKSDPGLVIYKVLISFLGPRFCFTSGTQLCEDLKGNEISRRKLQEEEEDKLKTSEMKHNISRYIFSVFLATKVPTDTF